MKKHDCFLTIQILGEEIIAPVIEKILNSRITNIPIDTKKINKTSNGCQKIYEVSTSYRYYCRFNLYQLIFNIHRRFIPDHNDFTAQFIFEFKLGKKEPVFRSWEAYRFQEEKLSQEELNAIKNCLLEFFGNFSEGSF
ncbi:MAG: hypothetical protein ACP5IX_00425 [Patescibacteria group bacterium]